MESWEGTAGLRWIAVGQPVGEERFTFAVECDRLPDDDRLDPVEVRRLVTLQLLCARARKRYGAPPRDLGIHIDGDDESPGRILSVARWRSGQFRHGSGILGVAPPPPGARLTNMQEITGEHVDTH